MANWVTPTAIHSVCGEHASYPAANLIDGSLSSFWAHLANELHWVVFDLGSSMEVTAVRLYVNYSPNDRVDGVDVYVSDDPTNWGSPVAENLSFVGNWAWVENSVTSKTGRYIKLENMNPQSSNNDINLWEFQAYASTPPPTVYSFIM